MTKNEKKHSNKMLVNLKTISGIAKARMTKLKQKRRYRPPILEMKPDITTHFEAIENNKVIIQLHAHKHETLKEMD